MSADQGLNEIVLTATLHRSVYQAMPTPQQVYILLEAMPTESAPGVLQPVNFSLVLDRSGSMAGDKLRQMRQAANLIVDRLSAQDLLSVVIFDDTADVIVPSGPVHDPQSLKRKIDTIQERGGTHMSTGMRAGLMELQRGLASGRVNRLLLLTDGQTWEDQEDCKALADQFQQVGIPINVMGLGLGGDWDPRLLEDLAQRSSGEWTIIDAPERASAAFEGILQSMQGTAVTNATLTMRVLEGVMPRTVWRVTPLISKLGHQVISDHDVQIFLGDIQHGVGQAVLADLLFPPRQVGTYRMIQADVTYDVPATGRTGQKATTNVVVNFSLEPSDPSQVNGRLMNIIERVQAHKLQTQALDDLATGQAQRATQRLRSAATRLLEIGESEMAQQANQQAEQIEQGGQIDQASTQKMRYETKKLLDSL
jgi:Ca-activated chloride channel homolog